MMFSVPDDCFLPNHSAAFHLGLHCLPKYLPFHKYPVNIGLKYGLNLILLIFLSRNCCLLKTFCTSDTFLHGSKHYDPNQTAPKGAGSILFSI